ncbi:MAG: hypothetical protein JKY53_07440 [Flavobacteriales bacterium]|nr:hypothetical protein [Flavobacteriales bacterium]
MRKIGFIIFLIFVGFTLKAQESISAQRPTMTESNTIVGPKIIQAETGVTYVNDKVDFNTFIRFGINERLEFRLASSFDSRSLDLSGKVFIYEGKAAIPGLSFQMDYNPFFGMQNYSISAAGAPTTNFFYTINAGNDYDWYGIILLGYAFGDASVFAEYKYHENYQQIHGGITYIIKGEVQLDINGGLIDFSTPYVGVGLAFRLKPFAISSTPTPPITE